MCGKVYSIAVCQQMQQQHMALSGDSHYMLKNQHGIFSELNSAKQGMFVNDRELWCATDRI